MVWNLPALIPALFFLFMPSYGFAESVDTKIQEGISQYHEGEFKEAVENFSFAHTDRPEDSRIAYNLGNAHYKEGKFEEALQAYTQSTLDEKNPGIRKKSIYNTGNTMVKLGKLEEAESAYKKVLVLDPGDMDAKYNLEYVRQQLKDKEKQKQDSGQDPQEDGPSEEEQTQNQQPKNENDQQERDQPPPPDHTGSENQENPDQPGESAMEAKISEEEAERMLEGLTRRFKKHQPHAGRKNEIRISGKRLVKMKMFLGVFKKVALFSLFMVPMLSTLSFGQNISVTATVDKNRLTLEDVLQLSIVIQGTQNMPPPELPSLPDLKITSAGTSSSTQYINTQRSVSITYKYRLTPMNTGTIVIGPARVRTNGKTYSTQPITIEVQKPSNIGTPASKTAFVETTLSSNKAYIGEQRVYTFRLFHRVEAKNLDLKLPFDKTWFTKEELGEPKSYIKVVNGLQYHVQELSIALFPLRKGKLEIPATTVELDLLHKAQSRSRQDPFSQFFNDPFFGPTCPCRA